LTAGTSVVTLAIPTDVFIDGALTIEATVGDDTYAYTKAEGATFNPGTYYQSTVTMAKAATDLSKLTGDYIAQDGETLTGTLAGNYKISIADGATVTLDGVTIKQVSEGICQWAAITCVGDATIILKDGSTNIVWGFNGYYPGIFVPEEKTLTIKGETEGTGSLDVKSVGGACIGGGIQISCGNIEIQGGRITADGSSDGMGAAIGGSFAAKCGTITISGGTITAIGSNSGAGIGSGHGRGSCGNITISGGTVKATGGSAAAGIGSGTSGICSNITISGGTVEATGNGESAGIGSGLDDATCGDIIITKDVTKVTATRGGINANSIGSGGALSTCGTVTIGGTVYWDGSAYQNDGETYLATSPLTYPTPPVGSVDALDPFNSGTITLE
jgi:hypothetical protein